MQGRHLNFAPELLLHDVTPVGRLVGHSCLAFVDNATRLFGNIPALLLPTWAQELKVGLLACLRLMSECEGRSHCDRVLCRQQVVALNQLPAMQQQMQLVRLLQYHDFMHTLPNLIHCDD